MTHERRVGAKSGKGRATIAIAVIGTLIASAALIWQLWQPPALGKATLPDGTQITLRGVTFGKSHRMEMAGPLPVWLNKHRLLRTAPPSRNEELLEPRSVVWFSIRPAFEQPAGQGGGLRSVGVTLLEDEHGCRYPGDNLELSYGMGEPAEQLIPVMLPEEPEGGTQWTIRGIPVDGNEPPVEFAVRGKGRDVPNRKPLRLLPESLPQTRSASNVRATLKSFWQDQKPSFLQWFAEIDAEDLKSPKEEWEPTSIVATDRWSKRGAAVDDAAIELSLLAQHGYAFNGLCRRESFWNLKVTLAPVPRPDREPDYDWGKVRLKVLRTIRVSDQRMINRVSRGVRLGISSVLLSGDGYASRPKLANATASLDSDLSFNSVRVMAKSVNGIPLLEYCRRAGVPLRDDRCGPQGYVDLGSPLTGLTLPNPDDAKTLEIELVGYRSGETVDFVVDPRQAKR